MHFWIVLSLTLLLRNTLASISVTILLLFIISDGQEQCVQPLGKFSVDTEQPEQLNNNIFHCVWSSLLEPRLLFP
jgi:hypothetical protein